MHVTEADACTPQALNDAGFNLSSMLPYGLQVNQIKSAMVDFIEFLGFVNTQLYTRQTPRLETMLMSANFSGIVSEYMSAAIPKYCPSLVKNRYHNGHPDLIPAATFPNDAVQYTEQGVEIKASRYHRGWQGHNPENVWLLVFVFQCDSASEIAPKPLRFTKVVGAQLTKDDWKLSGRSEQSRRTITASVTPSGYQKLISNWLYDASIGV